MLVSPELHAARLPADALPFLRELLLEIVRRLPPGLGTPPRFSEADMEDAVRCTQAAHTLVRWFDGVPDALGSRMEEWEQIFHSLLQVVQRIDNQVHRAVREARARGEEELTFTHSLREVLECLRADLERSDDPPPVREVLDRILDRIDHRQKSGGRGCLQISTQFDRVQRDLVQLREDIAQIERQTQDLREQNLRDPLTGLWNRRAYEERIVEELARAVRYRSPLSIALWDVDSFKDVNDAHGHSTGDRVLQALAARSLAVLRRSDVLARVGGEQFVVILSGTPAAQALLAGEKIRSLVADEPVETPDGAVSVTISVGVAGVREGDTVQDLLTRAERALHRAKTEGRNRVRGSGEEAEAIKGGERAGNSSE